MLHSNLNLIKSNYTYLISLIIIVLNYSSAYSQTINYKELIKFSDNNLDYSASEIIKNNIWKEVVNESYVESNPNRINLVKLINCGQNILIETEYRYFGTSAEFNGKTFYEALQIYHPKVGKDLNFVFWYSNSKYIHQKYESVYESINNISYNDFPNYFIGYLTDFIGYGIDFNNVSIKQISNTYHISISSVSEDIYGHIIVTKSLLDKIHSYHNDKVFEKSTISIELTEKYINKLTSEAELKEDVEVKKKEAIYLELAKKRLHDLSYEKLVTNTPNLDDINEFLLKFPKSKNIESLVKIKFEKLFSETIKLEDLSEIDKSIKNNSFTSEQLDKLEIRKLELIFNETKILEDISAIKINISEYKFNDNQLLKLNLRIDNLKLNKLVNKLDYFKIFSKEVLTSSYFSEVEEIQHEFLELKHLSTEKYIIQLKENVYNYTLDVMNNHDVCDAGDAFINMFPNYKTNYINDRKSYCDQKRLNLALRDSFIFLIEEASLPYSDYDADRILKMINQLLALEPSVVDNNINSLKMKWNSIKEFHRYKNDTIFSIEKDFEAEDQLINKWLINTLFKNKSKLINKKFSGNTEFFVNDKQKVRINLIDDDKVNKPIIKILKSNLDYLNDNLEISKWGNYVNAVEDYQFKYTNNTNELRLLFDRGNFSFYKDKINNNSLKRAKRYLNESNTNWQRGIYTFEDQNTTINSEEFNELKVLKYKSFSGILATIPSIVLPNVGIYKVTGKKNHKWVSVLFWGFAGSAAYYYRESEKDYSNYLRANNQSEMDKHYVNYSSNLATSRILTLSAVGINGISLVYVFCKGLANIKKSQKYNKIYNSISLKLK